MKIFCNSENNLTNASDCAKGAVFRYRHDIPDIPEYVFKYMYYALFMNIPEEVTNRIPTAEDFCKKFRNRELTLIQLARASELNVFKKIKSEGTCLVVLFEYNKLEQQDILKHVFFDRHLASYEPDNKLVQFYFEIISNLIFIPEDRDIIMPELFCGMEAGFHNQ